MIAVHSEPSHDAELERGVIASLLMSFDPRRDHAVVSDIVSIRDFHIPRHRAVMQGIRSALESSDGVMHNGDVLMLRVDAVAGAITAAGLGHIASITDLDEIRSGAKAPDLERAATRLREHSLRRHPDADAAFKRTVTPATATAPPVHSMASVARTRMYLGPPIATEFDSLDFATRGGLRRGTWIVMGGSPDAGKTTFGINIAMNYARRGVTVGFLACDEDMARIVERVGQSLGHDRDQLGADDPAEREALAATLERDYSNVLLFDGEEHTVESASAALLERAGGGDTLLMVDSIQTARSSMLTGDENDKARVDKTVTACKHATGRGLIVLAISELNRGAYANADPTKRIDDLASFKESGKVEYGAPVAFVMRSVKGTPDDVEVTFAKNKLRGPDVPKDYAFRLRLDRPRATFSGADTPGPVDREAQMAAAAAARFEHFKTRALDIVREHRDITSANKLVAMFEGDRNLKLTAVRELIDAGRLVMVDKAFRVAIGARS